MTISDDMLQWPMPFLFGVGYRVSNVTAKNDQVSVMLSRTADCINSDELIKRMDSLIKAATAPDREAPDVVRTKPCIGERISLVAKSKKKLSIAQRIVLIFILIFPCFYRQKPAKNEKIQDQIKNHR